MEETVLAQFERIEALENPMKKKTDRLSLFLKTCSMYIRKPDWIKYDAFREMSGKLSYAVALLDKEDNGILVIPCTAVKVAILM